MVTMIYTPNKLTDFFFLLNLTKNQTNWLPNKLRLALMGFFLSMKIKN